MIAVHVPATLRPDRGPLTFGVPAVATVDDAIREVASRCPEVAPAFQDFGATRSGPTFDLFVERCGGVEQVGLQSALVGVSDLWLIPVVSGGAPEEEPSEDRGEVSPSHLLFALIGFALHAFVGVFIFFSTLIAPAWAVATMGVVWAGALVVSVRRWRRSMWAPLGLAVATSMVWIVVVNLGDVLLGWTA